MTDNETILSVDKNRILSKEELNKIVIKKCEVSQKRSAIVYLTMKLGLVLRELSKKGYSIDFTERGMEELLMVKDEDIDSLSFSYTGAPFFE